MKKAKNIKNMFNVLVFGLALVAFGCSSGSGDKKPVCAPGNENCECKADGTCDTGLECKDNKCVKTAACTPGTENCECKADGTCDTGLECKDNKCVKPASCTQGTEDCECKADGTCDSGLECKDNKCVKLTCTPGTEDCQCKSDGSCEGNLECKDNKCQQKTCDPGTMGCPCKTDNSCNEGLECKNGTCVASEGSGLFVTNADVRACDIVFTVKDAKVAFTNSVTGVTATKGEKLAISFTFNADNPIAGPVASMTDAQGTPLTGITPDTVKCYDRTGKSVEKPGVTLK